MVVASSYKASSYQYQVNSRAAHKWENLKNMAEILGILKKSLWFTNKKTLVIDSWSFQLFNKVTSSLLVTFSILVTAKQFFGRPIRCDAGFEHNFVREEVLDSYCWMYAHFHIPKSYQGPCTATGSEFDRETPLYNSYYQWVPLYLSILAIMFYLPRILWGKMEGGVQKYFSKDTAGKIIESRGEKRDNLVEYFLEHIHSRYGIYFYGFIFCEILNFVMVILMFVMTNHFLNYRFFNYGIRVWNYYQLPAEMQDAYLQTNPMCYTFPRVAACDYHRFGGGGSPANINAICILGLNVINDKVFMILWWWLFVLAAVSLSRFAFRIVQVSSSRVRFEMLRWRYRKYFKNHPHFLQLKIFLQECPLGDWFVLYQMSKNINKRFFMSFLAQLAKKISPDLELGNSGDILKLITESKDRRLSFKDSKQIKANQLRAKSRARIIEA